MNSNKWELYITAIDCLKPYKGVGGSLIAIYVYVDTASIQYQLYHGTPRAEISDILWRCIQRYC